MNVKEKRTIYGDDKMTIPDCVELITGRSLSEDARETLTRLTVQEFKNLTEKSIKTHKGLTVNMIQKINAALALSDKIREKSVENCLEIRSPEDAFSIFSHMGTLDAEQVEIAYLNTKNKVIGKRVIFKGGLDSAYIHPREILKEAVKLSAAGIIMAHNHPSGNPKISSEDIASTARITHAAKILGIDMMDHLVIAGNTFKSLKQEQLMTQAQDALG